VLAVSLLLFAAATGAVALAGSSPLAYPLLALAGACALATFGTATVSAQDYLPTRLGFASGTTIGLAVGVGGLAAPAFGALADASGTATAIAAAAVLPLPGALAALLLPDDRPGR